MDAEREKFFEVGSFCYRVDIEPEDKEIKIKSSEMAPSRPNCPHLGRRVQFSSAYPIIALRCTPSENMGYFTRPPNESYHVLDVMFCPQQHEGSTSNNIIFAYVVFERDESQQNSNSLPEYIVRVITRNQLYGYENPDDYKLTSLPQRHRPLAVSAVSSSCLYCVSSDHGNAIYAFDYRQDEKTRQWHSTDQEISLSLDKPQERIAGTFRKLRCVSYQDQQLKAKQKIVEVMVFEVSSSTHDIRRRSDHFVVSRQEWFQQEGDDSPASFTRHPSCPLLLNSNYFSKDQKQGLLFSECCPGDAILQNFFVHKYEMNENSSDQSSPNMIFVVATFSDSSGHTTSPKLTLVAFPIDMSQVTPRIDSKNTHINFTLATDNINELFGDQEELIKQQRTYHSALKILLNNPINDDRVDEKSIFHTEISNDGRLLFIGTHVVFLVFYLDYRVFARGVLMQKASERNKTASTAFRRLPVNTLFNPLGHYYGGGGGSVTSICVLPFDIDFIVNNDSFFDSEESQSLVHATPQARLKALLEVAHSSNMYHGSAFKNRMLFFVKKQYEKDLHLYNLAKNTRNGSKNFGVNSGPLIVSPCGQFICSLPAKDELHQRQHRTVAGFELKEFVTHPNLKIAYKPLLTTIFPAHENAVKTLSYSTRVNANGSKIFSGIHRNVKSKQSIKRAVAADIAKAFSKL